MILQMKKLRHKKVEQLAQVSEKNRDLNSDSQNPASTLPESCEELKTIRALKESLLTGKQKCLKL